jgi:tRNA pseudouridine55 synthase
MPSIASTSGFLVLDKPFGLTSRAAVDHAQRWFPRSKLGHAGTLDPAATGVLVIGVGSSATRLLEYVQEQEKVYESTFVLGAGSTTDDAEGTITPCTVGRLPTEEDVTTQLRRFVGRISQAPPAYSAALVDGTRAYELARQGKAVSLTPRSVTVYAITLQRYDYPELDVEIRCGKGTYVRSIARDLGNALQTGGYVKTLRRTRIGPFTLTDAVPWAATTAEAQAALLPLFKAVSGFPHANLSDDETRRICLGQTMAWSPGEKIAAGQVVLLDSKQELIGLGEYEPTKRRLSPIKIFKKP